MRDRHLVYVVVLMETLEELDKTNRIWHEADTDRQYWGYSNKADAVACYKTHAANTVYDGAFDNGYDQWALVLSEFTGDDGFQQEYNAGDKRVTRKMFLEEIPVMD